MLSNISDLFTMASLVICMLLSGIIFYYLRTRISMLEQSVMDQAQLLQQVVTSLKSSQYRQQMNANAKNVRIRKYRKNRFRGLRNISREGSRLQISAPFVKQLEPKKPIKLLLFYISSHVH